jgi:hypothetical protein
MMRNGLRAVGVRRWIMPSLTLTALFRGQRNPRRSEFTSRSFD